LLDNEALTTEDSNFWVRELAASSPIGVNKANDGAEKLSTPSPFDNKSTKSIHPVMSLDKGGFFTSSSRAFMPKLPASGGRGRDRYYCRR
jgi:hypothetical protein